MLNNYDEQLHKMKIEAELFQIKVVKLEQMNIS